jgi:hypothetical protein
VTDLGDDDEERVRLLVAIERGLSAWEVDFVESVAQRVDDDQEMTERQREVADRIIRQKG